MLVDSMARRRASGKSENSNPKDSTQPRQFGWHSPQLYAALPGRQLTLSCSDKVRGSAGWGRLAIARGSARTSRITWRPIAGGDRRGSRTARETRSPTRLAKKQQRPHQTATFGRRARSVYTAGQLDAIQQDDTQEHLSGDIPISLHRRRDDGVDWRSGSRCGRAREGCRRWCRAKGRRRGGDRFSGVDAQHNAPKEAGGCVHEARISRAGRGATGTVHGTHVASIIAGGWARRTRRRGLSRRGERRSGSSTQRTGKADGSGMASDAIEAIATGHREPAAGRDRRDQCVSWARRVTHAASRRSDVRGGGAVWRRASSSSSQRGITGSTRKAGHWPREHRDAGERS